MIFAIGFVFVDSRSVNQVYWECCEIWSTIQLCLCQEYNVYEWYSRGWALYCFESNACKLKYRLYSFVPFSMPKEVFSQ